MCIAMKKGVQVWTYNNYKKSLKLLHYVPLLKDLFFKFWIRLFSVTIGLPTLKVLNIN
jgi:hypothetical protein